MNSDQLREKGNEILLTIGDNMAPVIKEKRLQEAVSWYTKAHESSTNDCGKSSAAKNLSITSFKLFKLNAFEKQKEILSHYYMITFHDYINQALTTGEKVQSSKWYETLHTTLSEALYDYIEYIQDESYKKRIDHLQKLLDKSTNGHSKCIIHFHIAKYIFEYSVTLVEAKDVKKALDTLKEFNYHHEECKRTLKYLKDGPFSIDIDAQNDDFLVQKHVTDGLYSKLVAQDLLEKCLNNEENLNMDLVYDIIDWYRDAIIKTHDRDIECEAEVSSDMGFMYDVVLCDADRAKTYYKAAWHLADSLKPKVFTRFKWFMRCAKAIQKYQNEVVEKEEGDLEKEKEEIMDKIKDDLEKIKKKSSKGYYDFLPFIYKDYPPKNSKHVLVEKKLDSSNIQKVLKDAITDYHPDKNSKEKYGGGWYFVALEITKYLNTMYTSLKLSSNDNNINNNGDNNGDEDDDDDEDDDEDSS